MGHLVFLRLVRQTRRVLPRLFVINTFTLVVQLLLAHLHQWQVGLVRPPEILQMAFLL